MPRITSSCLAVLFLLLPALDAQAAPTLQRIEDAGNITEVTLYQNLARVTRRIELQAQAGPVHILLPGLPGNLRGNSIQARGDAGLQIGSVSAQPVFSTELSNQHEQDLAERIQAAKDLRQTALYRIEAAKAQQAFIQSISAKSDQENAGNGGFLAHPDAWSKAWDAIGKGMTESFSAIQAAGTEIRKLDAELKKLEAELQQIRSNRRQSQTIEIAANLGKSGAFGLDVSYDVPNAWWQPQYRAALNSESGKIDLSLLAQIRQNTGEDWQGVAISLNTGRPSLATQLPRLEPWLLNIYEPQREVRSAPMAKMLSMDAMQAGAPEAMADEAVQIVEKGFAASYQLPGRQSLDSDNQPIEVVIDTLQLDSQLELQSVPKLNPHAFLVARFALPDGRTFPLGKVVLTRDGDYVGEAQLPDIPAGKPIEFGFGQDDKLIVDYRRLPPEAETSGFKLIGKSEIVTHRYVIKLQNRHQRALPLKVIDQLPVAVDERIEVSPLWDSEHGGKPPQQDLDERKGVVAWSWELAPGANRELRFGYSIKYPQGLQVPGI